MSPTVTETITGTPPTVTFTTTYTSDSNSDGDAYQFAVADIYNITDVLFDGNSYKYAC